MTIQDYERTNCIAAARDMVREVVKEGTGGGFVPPTIRLCDLRDWHWQKIVEAVTSGWIIERSRQMTKDRLNEAIFLGMGEEPEPFTLGAVQAILPDLGKFIEQMDLKGPIHSWSKLEITLFVRRAADLVQWAETQRDERPTDPNVGEVLMAG
jgi:hypothetical protein